MSTNANYAASPRLACATISTANTAKDGTGTVDTVFTAGASGSRIDAIYVKAKVTTTAGAVRFFIHNGTNYYLLTELPIVAVSSSATASSYEAQLNGSTMSQLFPILLPTGYSLRASTNNAEAFNILAQGGDF